MKTSEQTGELMKALASVQPKMVVAAFDSENPHFRSKYAGLSAVREVAGALNEVGIAIVQDPQVVRREWKAGEDCLALVEVIVTTRLQLGEQWIESSLALRPAKDDPHGVGSAITYARRYTLSSIVGMAADADDDANAATVPDGKPPAEKKTEKKQAETKKAAPQAAPPASASDEQRKEVVSLFSSLGLSDGQKANALVKYKITSLEKMTAASAEAILAPMRKAKAKKDAEAPKLDRTQIDAALGVLAGVVEQLAVTEEQRDAMVQKIYGQKTLAELNPQEIIEVMDALGNQYGGSDA